MRRRLRKILAWGTLLTVAIVIGGGWFAFSYVTNSETLRLAIQAGAPKFLPGSAVTLHSVHLNPFLGRVVLKGTAIAQIEGKSHKFVGISPWIELSFDPRGMLEGRFDLKEIDVAQPTLRVRRRKDGSWNLLNLLAKPWPMPPSDSTPPIRIKNGTVEILDESDGPDAGPAVVLRDVSVSISAGNLSGMPIRFEATARGDLHGGFKLAGSIDRATGRISLNGDLNRLAISKTLGDRLPREARDVYNQAGLVGGEVDLTLRALTYEPKARIPIRYDLGAKISSGVWKCDKLPFPVNDLSATLSVRDGIATVHSATGHSGPTTAHVSGTIALADPVVAPFQMDLSVENLAIDRVEEWSEKVFKDTARTIRADFKPKGTIDVEAKLSRTVTGGKIGWEAAVGCRDVSMEYREFKYPLQHVSGELLCRQDRVTVDLHSLINGKPFTATGTIDDPGPKSKVALKFTAGSLPIDAALLAAMPPDVRENVDAFKPAGTVRGEASVTRTPPTRPGEDQRGTIAINADLDFNPGGEMTWKGLTYPVRDLIGHLEIHPDSWIFRELRGKHGQATITGEGRVDRVGRDKFRVDLHINADNLLFENQLRDALPPEWLGPWNTLNPTGASNVDVTIKLEPGKADDYLIKIDPRPQTNLRLRVERLAVENDPGGPREIEMLMEDVKGRFVYKNGTVTMSDGAFSFRDSPVKFDSGTVRVFDSGKFALAVSGLRVSEFRFDANLRKLMPPMMAAFALRLDGNWFNIHTDLAIGWSGKSGDPATCAWQNGTVTFLDNSIAAGIPLKHIQGQMDHLRGGFDGRELTVDGAINLGSVNLFDVQITDVSTPIKVGGGKATFGDIRGTLMKGELVGSVEIGFESTTKFATKLAIRGADLQSFARSIPGKQSYKGLVFASLDLSGLGQDLHSLQGSGEAHITQGDLGKLPTALKVVSVLNLSPASGRNTLFDQADVTFTIRNGVTSFDPIRFVGNVVSLYGHGRMDVQGELDIKLAPLYSRDAWHVPGVSDLVREAEGQILTIRVLGTATAPSVKREFLPAAGNLARSIVDRNKKSRPARERR